MAEAKSEQCCAEFYEHPQKSGESLLLCVDCGKCIDLPAQWNNIISSVNLRLRTSSFPVIAQVYSKRSCYGNTLNLDLSRNAKCATNLTEKNRIWQIFSGTKCGIFTSMMNDNIKSLILNRG